MSLYVHAGRRRFCVSGLALAVAAPFGCSHAPDRGRNEGWVTVLDASKLADWQRLGDANWRVVDGLVQADRGNGYLVSANTYADVRVRAEFWVDDNANSGVFLRCQDPQHITPFNSYEINIFDKTPNPGFGTGSIVALARAPSTIKAGGRWNVFDIEAKGPNLTVALNGSRAVELNDGRHVGGPIALQYAAGIVKFRKVEIRLP